MVVLVAMSNQARDRALAGERHAYDVNLLTRAVDASIARAEAGLGRFVLDENVETSGNIYYSQWRLAGQQINQLERLVRSDPQQRKRVQDLYQLYRVRGDEFALAARATVAKRGSGGTGYFYQAAGSLTGTDLSAKLADIAAAERTLLRQRMEQTHSSPPRQTSSPIISAGSEFSSGSAPSSLASSQSRPSGNFRSRRSSPRRRPSARNCWRKRLPTGLRNSGRPTPR